MTSLDGQSLTLAQVVDIAEAGAPVEVAAEAMRRVAAARAVVDAKAAGPEPAYGINTGFGSLADIRIAPGDLAALQVNLLRSHAAGVGEAIDTAAVRAMMVLRANVLAKGFSGIRPATLDCLVELLNRGVHPVVPSRGSVGASGDLAPLAHLALVLIGEGEVLHPPGAPSGPRLPGVDALRLAGLPPVVLAAKEGLALINGTQASTAVLGLALVHAERLARSADVAVALSLDALRGSVHPFEARIHAPRPHPGQGRSAANILSLLEGSGINKSHEHCGKVQDAYALRCAAQVHGAARDAIAFARRTFEIEANSATDNPMVFADTGDIVSCGNFHGAPVAIASDVVCLAAAQIATISERRCDRLMNPVLSELPPFLTPNSGLHSGFMMAQVTAAALTSEIKTLCHPASVDTIPTSANKEDHVSMSMGAALKARRAVDLATDVLAIEILCACQALDLLAPLKTSPPLDDVRRGVRSEVAHLDADRPPSPDIARVSRRIASGALLASCGLPLE